MDGLGIDVDETAGVLKRLSETDNELANSLVAKMEALNEQAVTAGLFDEIGKGDKESSAIGKMEAVVKSLQESEGLDEPQAWELAMKRHPETYTQYLNEQGA